MTCLKPASPASTRTLPARRPPARWPPTGPTWKPGPGHPGTAAPPAPTQRPPGDTATPTSPAPGRDVLRVLLSAAVMVRDEHGPAVPELARRMTLSSCHLDPVRALAPVLTA